MEFKPSRRFAHGLPVLNLFVRSFYIPARSMEDTLQVHDRFIALPFVYRFRAPRFQEIAILRAPVSSGVPRNIEFVKRCVGVPGDVVFIRYRHLYRNGVLVDEPYVKWSNQRDFTYGYEMKIVHGVVYSRDYDAPGVPGSWTINGVPLAEHQEEIINQAASEAIPPNHFLMLGDFRNNSNDSHLWGLAPRADIVAKAVYRYAPPERAGRL